MHCCYHQHHVLIAKEIIIKIGILRKPNSIVRRTDSCKLFVEAKAHQHTDKKELAILNEIIKHFKSNFCGCQSTCSPGAVTPTREELEESRTCIRESALDRQKHREEEKQNEGFKKCLQFHCLDNEMHEWD